MSERVSSLNQILRQARSITRMNFKNIAALAIVLVLCSMRLCVGAAIDANELFRVGDQRLIEVPVPKRGFVGAPPCPAGHPQLLKTPTWDRDFRKHYVPVTVVEIQKMEADVKVELCLDEVDPDGDRYKRTSFRTFNFRVPHCCGPMRLHKLVNTKRGIKRLWQPYHLIFRGCTFSMWAV
jgi:hypothetical protein